MNKINNKKYSMGAIFNSKHYNFIFTKLIKAYDLSTALTLVTLIGYSYRQGFKRANWILR